MSVITLLILSVLVGWLATLTLHSDIGHVSLPDFATAVIGAGIAGRPIAVWVGDLPAVIGAIESHRVRAIRPVVGEAAGVDDKTRR